MSIIDATKDKNSGEIILTMYDEKKKEVYDLLNPKVGLDKITFDYTKKRIKEFELGD